MSQCSYWIQQEFINSGRSVVLIRMVTCLTTTLQHMPGMFILAVHESEFNSVEVNNAS
jgi:hypothetical protein